MKENRFTALLVLGFILLGCGANKQELKYTKGPMPADGNFDGVYQSDFGRMELTADGSGRVVGLYEKNDVYGRLEGEVEGNLLFFKWTQWNEEMRGKTRETTGDGVFQYIIEEVPTTSSTKKYHKLAGWWNYGEGELTNPWNAAKLSERAKKRLKPYEPTKSEMETGAQNYSGSIGFDSANQPSESSESSESSTPPEQNEEESGESLDMF